MKFGISISYSDSRKATYRRYPSASAAKGARDAVSSDGRTLLPLAGSTELGAFHFDDAIGALTFQPHSGATGATGTTGTTGTSGTSGAAAERPAP